MYKAQHIRFPYIPLNRTSLRGARTVFRGAGIRQWMIALIFAIVPNSLIAAEWKTTATVSASELYTDNVRLSTANGAHDFVSELSPSIGVSADGARVNLDFNYSINFIEYRNNQDLDDVRQSMRLNSDFELMPEHLAVRVNSAITQQISSSDRQGSGLVVGSSNVVDTFQNRVSGSWNSQLGDAVLLELTLGIDQVDYISNSTSGLASSSQTDSMGHNSHVDLRNSDRFRRLFWFASFRDNRIDYENDDQAGSETGSLSIGYRWDLFSVSVDTGWQRYKHRTATGSGQPDNEFSTLNLTWHPSGKTSFTVFSTNRNYDQGTVNPDAKEQFIGSRFSWTPSVRTSLNASTGNDFSGNTYSFGLTHKSRKSNWGANYSETVTDFRQLLFVDVVGLIVCPAGSITPSDQGCRQEPINNPLVAAGEELFLGAISLPTISDSEFINKHGVISYSYKAVKSDINLSVFQSDRFYLASNLEERDIGVRLGWNWKFGRISTLNIAAARTKKTFQDGTEGTFSSFDTSIRTQIGRKSALSLVVHVGENVDNSSTSSYEESNIRILISTSLR